MSITIDYRCRNCGHEFPIGVTPEVAPQCYGPPERCHDGAPPELDAVECELCNTPIDLDLALEQADEAIRDAQIAAAEAAAEREREGEYFNNR